mmetsp:Transcript_22378/g.66662  ORF Transcript_22378/g.66662 Transcript_22378/m.66662 type:complete len:235 (+) Transcript_22378:626-1330(+)
MLSVLPLIIAVRSNTLAAIRAHAKRLAPFDPARSNVRRTTVTASSFETLPHRPSEATITNSWSGMRGCTDTVGSAMTPNWRSQRLPIDLDMASIPMTRAPVPVSTTRPPHAVMRSASDATVGAWSSVSWMTPLAVASTARESPVFAHTTLSFVRTRTQAVEPPSSLLTDSSRRRNAEASAICAVMPSEPCSSSLTISTMFFCKNEDTALPPWPSNTANNSASSESTAPATAASS